VVGFGADVELRVDLVGTPLTHSTDPILTDPGLLIELKVDDRLATTTYSIRER
jgi:hypothetical protein